MNKHAAGRIRAEIRATILAQELIKAELRHNRYPPELMERMHDALDPLARLTRRLRRLDPELVAELPPDPTPEPAVPAQTPSQRREPLDPMAAIMHSMVTVGRKAP